MLRLIEVASQSVTFSTRVLENHESKQLLNGWPKPGHYRPVFSIDRPPLLAVRRTAVIYSLFEDEVSHLGFEIPVDDYERRQVECCVGDH